MKFTKLVLLLLIAPLLLAAAATGIWFAEKNETAATTSDVEYEGEDADLPPGRKINKDEYLRLRNEQLFLLRGLDTAKPDSRSRAIRDMERSEEALAARLANVGGASLLGDAALPPVANWRAIGPAPIPVNSSTSYSGRVSAIAVDPTNRDIVYVGTAQGGLYRSTDGGATWTPMLDNALSLAIGSVAVAPSDPTTVFVGTGEAAFSADSFFGVGIYRITNATSATPTISGPLNAGTTAGTDVFTGRAVSEIVVHPTNPNIIFASTTSGIAGIGGTASGMTIPNAGLFRSTNAMGASPTFEKLTIQGTLSASRSVIDIAIEPDNPARLVAAVIGSGGDGGIYLTTNALDPTPTFTRSMATADGTSTGRTEFAVNKPTGGPLTIYAANGTSTGGTTGSVLKSTDGGATFTATGATNFCSPQCWYDMAIAVDPVDATKVYLGGSPSLVFGRSTNGGTSFTASQSGLHVDTHAIAVAPSDPNTIYFGSDGGIWRSTDGGTNWTTLNNSTFHATQFQGIAVHPTDRNYTLGGTQDNGTQFLAPDGTTWIRSAGGDGGFTAIDQNATDTTNVISYHTYYNSSGSQIGFRRAISTVAPGNPAWGSFMGCGGTPNGINCADAVLFYAPMVVGPNAPGSQGNTLYFGTTRLYRSIDRGTTMTDVSGVLPARISAIAVAPQNDDVRLVGTTSGTVYLSTTAGATTMADVTGAIPVGVRRYVGRVAIDPTNANIAYVAYNGFGIPAGQHVWKTTNLLSGSPTWTPAGSGIPDVPVNAFVVDPADPQQLFAGTDIGVFVSIDGGATWQPFSTNLPRVAVFGMEIQKTSRVLRIATHGRGMFETDLRNVRSVPFDFDGDAKTDVGIFRPAPAEWWILRSGTSSVYAAQFGAAGDEASPADFTGDGKTDVAFFRPSTGQWFVLRSENSTFFAFPFGASGDVAVPSDYDGDGKSDAAVFRPSTSTWYVLRSSDQQVSTNAFGIAGDRPVPADYDGDGRTDIAIYRPSGGSGNGEWWILRSTAGLFATAFGAATDKAVPGDYTGDGKADIAFFRPGTGEWFILRSENQSYFAFTYGTAGDAAVPGDYDGDGKFDAAVYRPSNQTWFINRSTQGSTAVTFGATGDQPIPNVFVR
ncbi:MAG: FG-GAP-like repeat-containing protein [Pyrinomonadaceae bacterium]